MTALTTRLGIAYPIIQAPMLGVSNPALAATVSNAGGLGSVGISASTPEQATAMIAEIRALTDKPFNVNMFCHRPEVANAATEAAWLAHMKPWFDEFGATPPSPLASPYYTLVDNDAMVDALVAAAPPVLSFHFGLPSADAIAALKAAGIVLFASATTLAEALQVEAAGIDVIVAQGTEAGGHRGVFDPEHGDAGIGTFALTRLIAAKTAVPVVAAGGIMDGQGIAAALTLGAQAAQLGTAFILTPESSANAAYRDALQSARALRTGLTAAISGRSARGIVNRFHLEVGGPTAPTIPDYPLPYHAGKALVAAAVAKGNHDFSVQWAGQAAGLARALPATELVQTLVAETRAAQQAQAI
ncbi:nitronate monooxygenase [Pigmentiphaga aceris]|uniref:Nitronate monooxygenase n=1 Tax=Pigmentiphaga aceris TaxID=1940612 RepID=A0A5C0ASF1_9BURK|nr:nitronate monooxygenase [Pigmentiphaga aceris]QEI04566.1 nitronate monooxygenase [Pigmentiphaga aceris]